MLSSGAVVAGIVLCLTLPSETSRMGQIVITHHSVLCVYVCVFILVLHVALSGSGTDMCLETLITSLNQQGC